MARGPSKATALSPLDLDELPNWLLERGMLGLTVGEQIDGFCRKVFASGFPLKRVSVGMYTLHPTYGSHTYVWRPEAASVEHVPRERDILNRDVYLKSPVHHMRSRGLLSMRRRLDSGDLEKFALYSELRAEGLLDYAAHIVPYDSGQVEALAKGSDPSSDLARPVDVLNGIFFSCATDRAEGFEEGQLDQVFRALPYLALSVKSRLTYDVASTVLETYLGRDAGHRVLTGAIERGSVEAIRAVIWFSDLRGFTALTDTLPRDLLVSTLNDYLEAMSAPVLAHNGQILKFMGDGLLATFDLTGREEAAVCRDALAAANELRSDFPVLNKNRKSDGKPIMDFGLSLHLGEVFYGNIGATERLDFTVIGPAVNEASRIQSLCRPLERNVLISSAFRKAAGSETKLVPLGAHDLRGVKAAQELFGLPG